MSDMMRILCPRCHTINRVPAVRLAEGPKCGQCHERLFTGDPIVLTTEDFDIHATRSDIPLVVDFWAPWCGPCKMIGPLLDEIARESEGRFRIAKVNIDDEPALMQRFGVRAVPTLLFFSNGEMRDQIVGGAPKKTIFEKLAPLTNSPAFQHNANLDL